MKRLEKVDVRGDKVTLVFEDRDKWGRLRRRQQITINRRNLEFALRKAEMTVPWQEVSK